MAGTEKIYYLKQQSPMLHFQHADFDATLRATELKPKLDRFIEKWLGKKNIEIPSEWRLKKDPEDQNSKREIEKKGSALHYRVRVFNMDGNTVKKPSPGMPYFGNMGRDSEEKKCVMAKGCIEVHIRCYIRELLDVIDDCLPTFFLTTNFGTRQDKGFGGFVLCGSDGQLLNKRAENEELLTLWYGGNRIYCIRYRQQTSPDDKLNDICTIYKILKSGINDPVAGNKINRPYIKSYLWEYFDAKGIDWEKKALKYRGIAPKVYSDRDHVPAAPGPNERYIRGLLGIGDQQQWFSSDGEGRKIIDHHNEKGKPVYKKETILIESENSDIKRIPSPLTFKIIGNTIYILPEEIDSRIPGSSFRFSNNSNKSIDPVSLQIPYAEEFDLNEILSGFRDKVNSPEVKDEFEKRPEEKRPVFIRQGCSMEVLGDKR